MYREYSNFPVTSSPVSSTYYTTNDDRLIGGGFAFPFLLGGVTGAALAPAFWRPQYQPYPPRPYPGPYPGPGYPRPYPYYRPF